MVLASIRSSVDNGFTVFFAWVPHVLGFLAVLVIGYIVAKIVGNLVWRLTHRAGLDGAVTGGPGGNYIEKVTAAPSRLLGKLAFWAIMLGTFSLAASVLGIAALTAFVGAIFAYLPNVLAALLIFLVAGAIAAAVTALVARTMGDTGLGKIVATAAPILIMAIATFMILDQLKIAHNIVVITYAALLGSIALGAALAFGLGGREVAGQMLQGAVEKGQENKEQFKQDLDKGIARGKEQVEQAKEKVGDSGSSPAPATQPAPITGGPAYESAYEASSERATETITPRDGSR